ncbi:MAG: HAMP domain-containing sensor histidine kinase, partial [Elusimicrobiota bacterium]
NSIITDILDFSKLQSGKLIFHVEKISPFEIAQDGIDSMKTWSHSKNINLTLNAQANLPDVYADKKRSVQILINLISNAIKFTPNNGSIEVRIETDREGIANFVFFSVKDTGCGIKKEDHERIFEKFVQVATGEKIGGTGLGLAITKAMVIMQGGKITVESEYGKGATFTFTLPVYKGQIIEKPPVETLPESRTWWKKLLGIK